MARNQEQMVDVLRNAGRPMSSKELEACGFSRVAIKRLSEAGHLERVARGIYAAADKDTEIDSGRELWAAISLRMPHVVFCLESAATYHGITQNMGTGLYIAVPKDMRKPAAETTGLVRANYLTWRDSSFASGIETMQINGVDVRVTDIGRTIVDLFRYSAYSPVGNTQKLVDKETFQDALTRFIDKEGPAVASSTLRKAAKPFGMWDRLSLMMDTAISNRGAAPVV